MHRFGEPPIVTAMYLLRELFSIRKILWVFYFAVALVFVQGAQLHVHTYDHDLAASDHMHQEQVHLHESILEAEHPDEVAEISLSQQGFLKNLSFGSLVIAFFVAAFVVLVSPLITRISWLHVRRGPLTAWLFSLRPPLRAPPVK